MATKTTIKITRYIELISQYMLSTQYSSSSSKYLLMSHPVYIMNTDHT